MGVGPELDSDLSEQLPNLNQDLLDLQLQEFSDTQLHLW